MQPHLARPAALAALAAMAVVAVLGLWPRPAASGGRDAQPSGLPVSSSSPPASIPAPIGLDPGLAAAYDAAVDAARRAGHHLTLTSGYRTVAEQEALLAEAIREQGRTEALRWVFPPERSMHVRGLAVDVGDAAAARWLDDHGARFGLCRTLAWEWWHFEWRSSWQASRTCPGPVDDPADAPGPEDDEGPAPKGRPRRSADRGVDQT